MSNQSFYNPYPAGTAKHLAMETLKDLEWHCAKCELPGSQPAKMLQGLRQDGWQFERTGQNWTKVQFCETCGTKSVHRRLSTLTRLEASASRADIPSAVRERIRRYYDGKDELLGYAPTGRTVEIDHRTPQVRWLEHEEEVAPTISDSEIERRFMLLARENNLLKSRHCERCVETGQRQPFLGISFFYAGDEKWTPGLGCVGCGWHHPRKWRELLNAALIRR